MAFIEGSIKKWGNSLAIIIPSDVVSKERMKEEQKIKLLLVRESSKTLKETFGMGKGILTKSGQEIKDELRAELYPE